MHLSQADKIIGKFGGISSMSRLTKFPKSTIQRWKYSGCIHPRHNEKIIAAAQASNVSLTASDFATADPGVLLNAPCTPSPDSTAPHAGAASLDPKPQTPESLTPSPASDDRIDAAANAGG